MKLTNKKIAGGVIALLAIVSLAQTQAILQIAKASNANRVSTLAQVSSEDQAAQVLNAARGCIEVLPPSDNRTSFIDAGAGGPSQQLTIHDYIIGVKIKNRCNYSITVLKDSIGKTNGLSDTYSNLIPIVKIQKFPNLNNPYEVEGLYNFTGPMPTEIGIDQPYIGQSADISMTNNNLSGVPSSFIGGTQTNNIWAYNIPANGSRDFIYNGVVGNGTPDVPTIEYVRSSLNKLRWFKTSSYNDAMLTSNEVQTFTYPTDSFVSSYAKLRGCQGEFVYDKQNNPIACE